MTTQHVITVLNIDHNDKNAWKAGGKNTNNAQKAGN
jgi:hypothetical protein